MTIKSKFIIWAVKRELARHEDDIRAEVDRLKGIRTLDELKAWSREKSGALSALVKSHGPIVLKYLRERVGDMAPGRGPKGK